MRLDLDHEPGELREKLPKLIAELVDRALADDGRNAPLEKGRRDRIPHEHADEFRFGPTRAMYERALARGAARHAAMLGALRERL